MAHTTQSSKSVGGTITRAELETFLANLEWFRLPPAYRLYNNGGPFQTLTSSLAALDFAGTPHYEWLAEGGDGSLSDGTYHSGTGGLWVNVGDVAAGLWLNGVMVGIENPASGGDYTDSASTLAARRGQLRRGDGSTWTELADYVQQGNPLAKRTGLHLSGIGTFSASTDRVEARGQSSAGSPEILSDRRWGVRLGDQTTYDTDYTDTRQISDTNGEVVAAFNGLRANQLRIERRPSGQRYKTGSNQALSAGVTTLVTMGGRDWATPDNTAPAGTFTNLVFARAAGIYLVTGQMTLASYDAGASFAVASIYENATTAITSANAPEANAYDTVVPVVDLVELADNDYVSLYGQTGTASSVQASRGTFVTATLMSSTQGVSDDRQVFAEMPAPSTWPDIANASSSHLTAGTLRVLSDLTDRQWHRPAYKARLVDDAEIGCNAGWTDVDVTELVFDYTDLEDTHGVSLLSGGALVLPWAGTWLVGARMSYAATTVDGLARGGTGSRGMRLALENGGAAGEWLGRAMNAGTQSWTRTLMETVVVNREEGQEIRLQGRVDHGSDFGDLPVTSASLWAVELGTGVTRDPR